MNNKKVKPSIMSFDYFTLTDVLNANLNQNFVLSRIDDKTLIFEERNAKVTYSLVSSDKKSELSNRYKVAGWEIIGNYCGMLNVYKNDNMNASPIMSSIELKEALSKSSMIKSMISTYRNIMIAIVIIVLLVAFFPNLSLYVKVFLLLGFFVAFISSFYIYYSCSKIRKEEVTQANNALAAKVYHYGFSVAALFSTIALIIYFIII